MKQKKAHWRKLDNAAKLYSAASNKKDTRVFRFYCELKEQVQGIEGKARELEGHVQGIRLTLENETNKNINIVAEGHLDPFCMITTALGKLYCVNH